MHFQQKTDESLYWLIEDSADLEIELKSKYNLVHTHACEQTNSLY